MTCRACILLLVSCLTPSFALAQDDDAQALALYEEGVAAYTEGRYEEAARAFGAAHELSPRPLLLYNLANAHERLGHSAQAVEALEAYLPHAPIDERAVIETRIANLRLRVERESAPDGEDGGEVTDEPPVGPGETETRTDSSGLLVPGVIVASAGVALLAVGTALGVLALDARSQVQDASDPLCVMSADRLVCQGAADAIIANEGTYALVADIGLIGGGVITAAGLVLVILALTGDDSGEEVSWVPQLQVGPGGASAGVVGRF